MTASTPTIRVVGQRFVDAPLLLHREPGAAGVTWRVTRLADGAPVAVTHRGSSGVVTPAAPGAHEVVATHADGSTVRRTLDIATCPVVITVDRSAWITEPVRFTAVVPDGAVVTWRARVRQPAGGAAAASFRDPAEVEEFTVIDKGSGALTIQFHPDPDEADADPPDDELLWTVEVEAHASVPSPLTADLVPLTSSTAAASVDVYADNRVGTIPQRDLDERAADLAGMKKTAEQWGAAVAGTLGLFAATAVIAAPKAAAELTDLGRFVAVVATTLAFTLALAATWNFDAVAKAIPRQVVQNNSADVYARRTTALLANRLRLLAGRRELYLAAAALAVGGLGTVLTSAIDTADGASTTSVLVAGDDAVACVTISATEDQGPATADFPFVPAGPPTPVEACPRLAGEVEHGRGPTSAAGLALTVLGIVVAALVVLATPRPERGTIVAAVSLGGIIIVAVSMAMVTPPPPGDPTWAGAIAAGVVAAVATTILFHMAERAPKHDPGTREPGERSGSPNP